MKINKLNKINKLKSLAMVGFATALMVTSLSGCNYITNSLKDLEQSWKGIPVTIYTYDSKGQLTTKIAGESVKISDDESFDIYTGNETYEKGSVLQLSIGGKPMYHVGDMLIAVERGINNLELSYAPSEIADFSSSTPWLSMWQQDIKNIFSGNEMLVVIKSQDGLPVAVYGGNSVSIHPTSIKNSTIFQIDGKRIFVYRCSYDVYDKDLLI